MVRVEPSSLPSGYSGAPSSANAPQTLAESDLDWAVVNQREFLGTVFPSGVKADRGEALNPRKVFLFSDLREDTEEARGVVEQMGLEPTTPTLRTWCSPS